MLKAKDFSSNDNPNRFFIFSGETPVGCSAS